jgi:hypothetical protein
MYDEPWILGRRRGAMDGVVGGSGLRTSLTIASFIYIALKTPRP